MILYHGSEKIIEKPIYGAGRKNNDYGLGFYCTESLELAKEWSVQENQSGFTNKYELDMTDLSVLDLSSDKYTVLNWMALLLENRTFDIKNDIAKEGKEYLITKHLPDVRGVDIIKGYRADDSYFSFAQSFLNNQLSIDRLSEALRLGMLGEQFVLISENAFETIKYLGHEEADAVFYWYKRENRNEQARSKFMTLRSGRISRDDVFLADIIRREL